VLDAEGFYLTADLGRFDTDGYLYLTGRTGDIIKTSTGRRISPTQVEAQLRSVAGVDQAMLVGDGRKCLVALCTCTGALSESDRKRVERALTKQIAQISDIERPAALTLIARPFSIDQGELTPNLKLRRFAIEARNADLIAKMYESIETKSAVPPINLIIN
jgi:long-chain acyl-CoA synthetase